MSQELKLRRGSTAAHSVFTGSTGEVTVDTDKKTIVVHDGTTPGGNPMMPYKDWLDRVATLADALAGTAGKYPDAAAVHAAIRGLAVGTVSQSGGVPTGAIIESFSDVNGEYVKYADGTLIHTSKALINRVTPPGEKQNNEMSPSSLFVGDVVYLKSIDFFNDPDGGLPYIYTFGSSLGRFVNSGEIGTGDFSWPPVLGGFTANSEIHSFIAIGRWY